MLERELKLTAPDPGTLDAVLSSDLVKEACISPIETEARQFLGVYYDTENLDFERLRCSLRARKEGDKFRAAFKLAGSMVDGWSQREEYEEDIENWLFTLDDLPEGDFKQRVTSIVDLKIALIQRVMVDMSRTIRNLKVVDSSIELVADQGVIRGTNGARKIYEIELELKRGKADALLEFGGILQSQFALSPSTQTKHSIGLSLC